MLCYVMLCYVVLCYVTLCYVMSSYDMLYYVMLYDYSVKIVPANFYSVSLLFVTFFTHYSLSLPSILFIPISNFLHQIKKNTANKIQEDDERSLQTLLMTSHDQKHVHVRTSKFIH